MRKRIMESSQGKIVRAALRHPNVLVALPNSVLRDFKNVDPDRVYSELVRRRITGVIESMGGLNPSDHMGWRKTEEGGYEIELTGDELQAHFQNKQCVLLQEDLKNINLPAMKVYLEGNAVSPFELRNNRHGHAHLTVETRQNGTWYTRIQCGAYIGETQRSWFTITRNPQAPNIEEGYTNSIREMNSVVQNDPEGILLEGLQLVISAYNLFQDQLHKRELEISKALTLHNNQQSF